MDGDSIHRMGRTARAGTVGDALSFASPAAGTRLAAIGRALDERLERRTDEGFDDQARPGGRFEVLAGERIATIPNKRAEHRKRSRVESHRRARARGSGDR